VKKPLLIFGASHGTGLEVARLARARGYPVNGFARSISPMLTRLGVPQHCGDALEWEQPLAFCRDCPDAAAAVCTIGGGPVGVSADFAGVVNVVDAVRAAGISRFVLLSSLGAGESRAHASAPLLAAIGPILEEKTRGEEYLRASGLAYTILRAGGLNNAPAGEGGVLVERPDAHGRIAREELAVLILDALEREDTVGRVYSAVAKRFVKEDR